MKQGMLLQSGLVSQGQHSTESYAEIMIQRLSSIENLLKTVGYVLEAIPASPNTPTELEEPSHELA